MPAMIFALALDDGRARDAFLGLGDHARLPSRFHARLSATASRLKG